MSHQIVKIVTTLCFLILPLIKTYAHPDSNLGQIIQITTQLNSYMGKPTWLLEIRDVDHNQTIPYLFRINQKNNTWTAVTYGRNYLITASQITFPAYQARYNTFKPHRIRNFCQLESRGHIIRAQSIQIQITGDLTPNSNTIRCTQFIS